MSHVQQQIFDALMLILPAGVSLAADNVHKERVSPLDATRLPAVCVEESARREEVGALLLDGTQQRTFFVDIACVVAHTQGYGDLARELGLRVEQLLGSTEDVMRPLTALCAGGIYLASSGMTLVGDGEKPAAVRLQTWAFTYFVHQAQPDVALS